MNRNSTNPSRLCAAFVLLGGIQCANAAGFYIPEVGTPASVGTAGVANPTNTFTADAAWTNPAGMTGMTEDSMLSGVMLSFPSIEFKSDIATGGGNDGGDAGNIGLIPSFFYTKVLSERWRLGFSITAPFGGEVDYGDNFVGRYAVQNVSLQSLALTPAVAYRVNDRLSLGVGLSFSYTTLEQESAVRRVLAPGAPDGKASFEDLEDWGQQAILGLTYQVSDRTLLGVVYRSESDVELEGDLKVRNLPVTVPTQAIELDWDNPQWLEVGARHKLNDTQTLFFNAGWQEWSAFGRNELTVTSTGVSVVEDREWDDTWHAGVAYAQALGGGRHFTLGLSYESSPVSDANRTFDFPVDSVWKMAGAYAWQGSKKLDYAIGATLYLFGDGKVDETAQDVRAAGEFDTYLNLFVGGTLRYEF